MKYTLSVAALILVFAACTPQPQNFNLKGDIEGLSAEQVYLRYNVTSDSAITDSATVTDGSFAFTGSVENPSMGRLMTKDYSLMVPVYLENGDMTVSGSADAPQDVSVTGSKTHNEYNKLQEMQSEVTEKMNALNSEFGTARQEGDEEAMQRIRDEYGQLMEEQREITQQFIEENPDSYVSLQQLSSMARNMKYEEANAAFTALSESVRNSGAGQKLAEQLEIMEKTSIGKVAPGFTQNNVDGEPVSLSDFRGQYVLIDFWAAWCGPCRAENPNLVAAYEEYKDDNFTILGVSLDQDREAWLKAIEEDGLPWTQVSDLNYWQNEVAQQYGVQAIPANYLLNPEGEIIAKNLRGEALDEKLAEVL